MTSFTFDMVGNDPGGRFLAAFQAAGADLGSHLTGDTVLSVQVSQETLPEAVLAWGSSADAILRPDGLYDPLAVWKLRTGEDPNGAAADILVKFDPAKAASADLVQMAAHELLHGLGFDGWGPGTEYQTPLDALTRDGRFTGAAAMAINGGPVPMAGSHYALPGVMNPFQGATHADVSARDLAFLADLGDPVRERFGTIGDDTLLGGAGDDILYGGSGADDVEGRAGPDALDAGAGNDLVRGGKGDDGLDGGEGQDTLWGDLGDDTLRGGYGNDVFAFRPGDGVDHIVDWELGDRLLLPGPYSVLVDKPGLTVTLESAGTTVILDVTDNFSPAWVLPLA